MVFEQAETLRVGDMVALNGRPEKIRKVKRSKDIVELILDTGQTAVRMRDELVWVARKK